jgi:hypothetical protein
MCDKQGRHSWLVHPYTEAIAGYARLRYFEYRTADPESITDANLDIGESLNCEILSELAEGKIIAPEEAPPISIRVLLIDEYRALLAAMTSEIGLSISVDVQRSRHPPTIDGGLPDGCSYGLAVPQDIAWKADI